MTNKGQFILTIPKPIVQILGWHDKNTMEFGFEKGKLSIKAQVSSTAPKKNENKKSNKTSKTNISNISKEGGDNLE